MNIVLCVDDDAITLMLCTATIKNAQFSEEIITLFNGQEAIEFYESLFQKIINGESIISPHLIILDLNMPLVSGWEFLDEFMEKYYPSFRHTKVVILSSTVDPRDKERAKQYPIVIDFFSKPITKEILFSIMPKLKVIG